MLRFRCMQSLQKFAAVPSSGHTYFDADRILPSRDTYTQARTAGIDEQQVPDKTASGCIWHSKLWDVPHRS